MIYKLTILTNEGDELYTTSTNDFDNLRTDVRRFKLGFTYTEEHEKELNDIKF